MKYSLQEIATITGTVLSGQPYEINSIITDSRTLSASAATLFVALRGGNHDGHDYIRELYGRGIRAFMVENSFDTSEYPQAGFINCKNTLDALQTLAAYHRSRFGGKVVAITGSNGKTVTKEWIAQLCPDGIKLFRSPKSYNSQIGVPLSLLMLEGDEEVAVIEAGISQPGEMRRLEQMIRPDIGIVTTIGDAHQENFRDLDEKVWEKLHLFDRTPDIIYNGAYPEIARTVEARFGDRKLVDIQNGNYDLKALPFADRASRENAAEAVALYELLGFKRPEIEAQLGALQNVAMRLELKDGIQGCKIINDSYNSDINSLSIALDYLVTVSGGQKRVLILSDIRQSGMLPHELYAQVAALLKIKGVDHLIGIGEEIFRHADLFSCRKDFYLKTENFLSTYNRSEFINQSILIKGSRAFHFEKISRALENKTHTTVLEVNLDNMIHNLNYFRGLLGEGVKMMAMVKAMGYGSGTYEVASMLQHQGVHYLAVAFADEGVTLREAGITMPIVVLNADSDSFELMVDYHLEPEIYNSASLLSFAEAVRRHGENNYPIHIKLDTGMHRLGFEPHEIETLISTLRGIPGLHISTVFSHMAASDESRHDDFTRAQIDRFRQMSGRLQSAFPQWKIIRHICNTAGIERYPQAQFDMVRLGIGLYGVGFAHQEHLLPVSTLKSRIVQIKELKPGETVGYGRHGIIERPTRTATVPIGYADGLDRHLSRGRWSMVVNGQKAPIIGNICMDTCMLDVTDINAAEGDSVEIFGPQATVSEMAEALDTIPYEIMTSISTRVKRIYTKE